MAETFRIPSFTSVPQAPPVVEKSTAIEYIKDIPLLKDAPSLKMRVTAAEPKTTDATSLIRKVSYVAATTLVYILFLKYTAPYTPLISALEIGGYLGGSALCTLAFLFVPVGKIIDTLLGRKIDTTVANYTNPSEDSNEIELFCDKERLKHSLLTNHRAKILHKYLDHEIHHNLTEKIVRIALSALSLVGAVYLFQGSLVFLGTTKRTFAYIAGDQLLANISNSFSLSSIYEEFTGQSLYSQLLSTPQSQPTTLVKLEDFLPHAHEFYSWEKERRTEILKEIVQEMEEEINQNLGSSEPAEISQIRQFNRLIAEQKKESSLSLLQKAEQLITAPKEEDDIKTLYVTLQEIARAIPGSHSVLQTWTQPVRNEEIPQHLKKIARDLKIILKAVREVREKHPSYKKIQTLTAHFKKKKTEYLYQREESTTTLKRIWKKVALGIKISLGILGSANYFQQLEQYKFTIPKGDKGIFDYKEKVEGFISGFFQTTITDLGEHVFAWK